MTRIRYRDIVERIDVDAFEKAIGFEPLSQKGDEDIGKCPDIWGLHKHGDTTGKFAINREKKVYHCFVCSGGSLLSLVMDLKDLEADEATEWIAKNCLGDKETDDEFLDWYQEVLEPEKKTEKILPYFNVNVLDKWDEETDWFSTRGISRQVAYEYNLRYSKLVKRPSPRKGGEKIDEDYLGPAVVFPHFWANRLVGWQYRWLDWDKEKTKTPRWLPKWNSTSEFPKDNTLYNYTQCLRQEVSVPIICESIATVLFLATRGYAAISYFGGDIHDNQLKLLRVFQQGVALAPDNDSVGEKFARKAAQYLEKYIPVYILDPVEGEGSDLGDLDYNDLENHLDTLKEAKLEDL